MLKTFMPKEAAEKIAGMVEDGTFDRIGSLPSDIQEIKAAQKALGFQLAEIQRTLASHALQGRSDKGTIYDNVPPGIGINGHSEVPLIEHAPNRDVGGNGTAHFLTHDRHCESDGES